MKCENCGKEHDGSYGSGRFCCKECARSFSTKNSKKELKEVKCIDCGKTILVGKRSNPNDCRCDECLKKHRLYDNLKGNYKCPICGEYRLIGHKCINEVCNSLDLNKVKKLFKYGLNKKLLGTNEFINEFIRFKEEMYDLYWNKGLSGIEIGELYNIKDKHFTDTVLKTLNIPIRTFSETTANAYIHNRLNVSDTLKFKCEWHKTWDGKLVYLRSSYESDYASKLDNKKIIYEVENLSIKYFNTKLNSFRYAIPDFYLPETNTIIEIKSTWTLDIQEMKDKVKEYKNLGYNFKLILNLKEVNIEEL